MNEFLSAWEIPSTSSFECLCESSCEILPHARDYMRAPERQNPM